MKRFMQLYKVAALASVALPSIALACPLCKDAIANDPVAAAFNWTTLLLIAVPSLLVASIGGWVFYVYWRAAQAAARELRLTEWTPAWTGKESET